MLGELLFRCRENYLGWVRSYSEVKVIVLTPVKKAEQGYLIELVEEKEPELKTRLMLRS